MEKSKTVRDTRDGDQFHYWWAANRCLLLLNAAVTNEFGDGGRAGDALCALTIEGASPKEAGDGPAVKAGEEVIDVAEYYGDETLERALRIRCVQLKHATSLKQQNTPFAPSGLQNTIQGFAKRYKDYCEHLGEDEIASKVTFHFVTNRPISERFVATIAQVAAGTAVSSTANEQKLEQYTKLKGESLAAFCRLLHLEGGQADYIGQAQALKLKARPYSAEYENDVPQLLHGLVCSKAGTNIHGDNRITPHDVLQKLGFHVDDLFPAPCRLQSPPTLVPREQEVELLKSIVQAECRPVILHAHGGVGKSVFATRIGQGLPKGSSAVLYDCFDGGEYRRPSQPRHTHKRATLQLVNELAGQGLCLPLLPFNALPAEYLGTLLRRLEESVATLRATHPEAVLCLIIDAADNAQMAAEARGDGQAFITDLLRERLPEGVRLVALCRTERIPLLAPPAVATKLALAAFSPSETAAHLRVRFPEATDVQADHFHFLTSQNPRVQFNAMAGVDTLDGVLTRLGSSPRSVEEMLASMLDEAWHRLEEQAGAELEQLRRLCRALATLRPRTPIAVLAAMSGLEEGAVRSLAADFGKSLLLAGNTLQFRDEPTETWFRNTFRPNGDELAAFADSLRPLATVSAYAAAVLPQLLLEAGQLDELIALALSEQDLPDDPVARRDVAGQRLQFALKACLREKRYADAAKLAFRAGAAHTGETRQYQLLQEETDLAIHFLEDADRAAEIVSMRYFQDRWPGSRHVYEAGLLSGYPSLQQEAMSRTYMAEDWLHAFLKRSQDERRHAGDVSHDDIAELAMVWLNLEGPEECAWFLHNWSPPTVAFHAGLRLARRLVDRGSYDTLGALALAESASGYMVMAITLALREVGRMPPAQAALDVFLHLRDGRISLPDLFSHYAESSFLLGLLAVAEAACRIRAVAVRAVRVLLKRLLPANPPTQLRSRYLKGRFPILRMYALHAALAGKTLLVEDLTPLELLQTIEEKQSALPSQQLQEFRADMGLLFPWLTLWGRMVAREVDTSSLQTDVKDGTSREDLAQDGDWEVVQEIARLQMDIAVLAGPAGGGVVARMDSWRNGLRHALWTQTLLQLARVAAHSNALQDHAIRFAREVAERFATHSAPGEEREPAEERLSTYCQLARDLVARFEDEAKYYFDAAMEAASGIGDENWLRWEAVLACAEAAGEPAHPDPELAHRLARCATVSRGYVTRDKHFDFLGTAKALAALCPSSALAICSRWRDRGFGNVARVTPQMLHQLVTQGSLDARDVAALFPLRFEWDRMFVLDKALDQSATAEEKQHLATELYRYLRLEMESTAEWRHLGKAVATHGVILPDLEEEVAWRERHEAQRHNRQGKVSARSESAEAQESNSWDAIFDNQDPWREEALRAAYARSREVERYISTSTFLTEAIARVPQGREAAFIKTAGAVFSGELYEFARFLEVLPDEWRRCATVPKSVSAVTHELCRERCLFVEANIYGEAPLLEIASAISGTPATEFACTALEALGRLPEAFEARRLFTLINLLAMTLSTDEASQVVAFGLEAYDGDLQDEDGDGPWATAPRPPEDVTEALAGYLWTVLASPWASQRWEAAHAVRLLCQLGRKDLLRALMGWAQRGSGGAFADAMLHFYALHARQWLCLALARAALEVPEVLRPHFTFLENTALREDHVIIRMHAQRAALAVLDGCDSDDDSLRRRLKAVNTPGAVLPSDTLARWNNHAMGEMPREGEYRFAYDIHRYWLAPLGACFAKSEREMMALTSRVLLRRWCGAFSGDGREDARTARHLYDYRDTRHSHGSYPVVDDLDFYLSYHAMCLAAGELLATEPTYRSSEESWGDNWEDWLRRHDLSRTDGQWLADRIDPRPLDLPDWDASLEDTHWPASIRKVDFETRWCNSDRLTLWGRWTASRGGYKESVEISSALVSPETAPALLRALQAASPITYGLPDMDTDHLLIDVPNFSLRGWVLDRYNDTQIDGKDPWGKGAPVNSLTPGPDIVDCLGLKGDAQGRVWQIDGQPVVWSQAWSLSPDTHGQSEGTAGSRLVIDRTTFLNFLHHMKMDCLIDVRLRRHTGGDDNYRSDGYDYIPPSARVFLLHRDGKVSSV